MDIFFVIFQSYLYKSLCKNDNFINQFKQSLLHDAKMCTKNKDLSIYIKLKYTNLLKTKDVNYQQSEKMLYAL